MMKKDTQKLIAKIQNEVLSWDEITLGENTFGGIDFLFRKKEIGHIHWSGDLDILFGKKLTAEFLKHNLVQKHNYVPTASITYSVFSEENVPFAISLLRFFYLIQQRKISSNNQQTMNEVETELSGISFYSLVKDLI
jgi:hypothetical protein